MADDSKTTGLALTALGIAGAGALYLAGAVTSHAPAAKAKPPDAGVVHKQNSDVDCPAGQVRCGEKCAKSCE